MMGNDDQLFLCIVRRLCQHIVMARIQTLLCTHSCLCLFQIHHCIKLDCGTVDHYQDCQHPVLFTDTVPWISCQQKTLQKPYFVIDTGYKVGFSKDG